MTKYNRFVHKLARWEIGKALIKSLVVRSVNTYINAVAWLPQKTIRAFQQFVGSAAKEYS